ncbi:SAM-dependent methyltransferase [Herbidospora mongoliensis]|uniref:SAM-dependent methyltransferase n=1 Tax=Herbidospora mongoliensis TaxID=688067 RepID=UPI00083340A9|nr:SAM-dependent methyltransferase [Herbidospora mongoliensis]
MSEPKNLLPWASPRDENAPKIDTSIPHSARVYDYWLGGKDNFEADRRVAEAAKTASPGIVQGARDNRAFLGRAVKYIAEQGITQFLDIGTGIPTQGNTHEVAQQVNPAARIAYVDNDPIVMTHARALLRSTRQGRTTYVEADLRDPRSIIDHPEIKGVIDFSEPLALVIVGTLMFINDKEDPLGLVRQFTEALVPGSYFAVSHVTADFFPKTIADAADAYNSDALGFTPRTKDQISQYFTGFELAEPGLVALATWRSDEDPALLSQRIHGAYGAVGRKS